MAKPVCVCGHSEESHAWAPILGKRTGCLLVCKCSNYVERLEISATSGGLVYYDRFDDILKEMSLLHSKKGQDYGGSNDPYANVRASEEFGIDGWIGALVRLNDKIVRLQSFIRNGKLANESVEDSIQDIAVYAVIMRILYDEQYGGGK